jgi:hypothetical protein
MEEPRVVPDKIPEPWPEVVAAAATCTCAMPLPHTRATWKGAARTVCDRCGLPIRIDFRL